MLEIYLPSSSWKQCTAPWVVSSCDLATCRSGVTGARPSKQDLVSAGT